MIISIMKRKFVPESVIFHKRIFYKTRTARVQMHNVLIRLSEFWPSWTVVQSVDSGITVKIRIKYIE